MIDFTPLHNRSMTYSAFAATVSPNDLRPALEESADELLAILKTCTDADVTFVPTDPAAKDDAADRPEDAAIAWTAAHIIVHVTASAEETAFLGAELARGVTHHGRSRSEVPWETVTTVAQCRQRVIESRRMRLAARDMWPDTPDLTTSNEPFPSAGQLNAIGYMLLGLIHEQGHLAQLRDAIGQAQAARGA